MSSGPHFSDERNSASVTIQSVAGSVRSFLGPCKAAKCVLEEGLGAAPIIATSTLSYLEAIRVHHPAFSLLMELVEGQVRPSLLLVPTAASTAFGRG